MLFDEFFDDFFDGFYDFNVSPAYRTNEQKKCPVCGRTYADFRQLGKFGCGECYKTFRSSLEPLIKQMHTSSEHTGKIPSKSGADLKKKKAYEKLKSDLQKAVAAEDYETAAKLHKQIRDMENEV